jgi:hypothetical protein
LLQEAVAAPLTEPLVMEATAADLVTPHKAATAQVPEETVHS